MAVSISISITQNSQNVTSNTSNVTVKVTAKWTNGSYNAIVDANGNPRADGYLKIDGTQYYFASTFNTGQTTSGSQTICTKTVNVSHDADGTKTLSCSASYATGVSSGTVTASASKELTMIPRKSTLTVANGTLGTAQTLTITEQASTFKHKLKYACGDASGWILGGSSSFSTANSVDWTPPLSLAQQNTTGTSVSVTFTLYTYTSDGTSVGSNTYTKTFSIPSSVKPSVSVAVSDPTGYKDTYGAYVQGLSKMKIVATASGSQGSTIKSYKTQADGKTYTAATVETDAISGTGTLTIKVTVTDSRGRTATASTTVSVLAYEPPKISALSVYRCDASGNASSSGAYLAVKFSATITSLNSKNTAAYSVNYKKSSATSYTTKTLSDFAGKYSVSNGVYIFSAETSSSYVVTLTVNDAIKTVNKSATGSSVKKVWSMLKKAGEIVGIAFDKIAEHEGVFEIGFKTLFTGGILPPTLEPDTDLNDVQTPNTYTGENLSTYNYGNCPVTNGTFTLLVESCGESGQIKQTFATCSKYKPERYSRFYYQGAWGDWFWANTDEIVLYNNESGSTGTITLSADLSNFRYIEIYFADNNFVNTKKTGGYTKVYNPAGKNIMLSISEASSTIYYRQTAYTASGTTLTPDETNASFIKITAAGVVTVTSGANYIRILRVIGRA